MKYGCIGEKLGHSFSKEIHARLGDYPYELVQIAPNDLDRFMKARDFLGINVTIPYKQVVIPYLDEIDPRAERIGAVNTIVNKNGKLFGYNTDYLGLKALIERNVSSCVGKKAVVLGSGGTSRTARCVLSDLGAESVITVGRTAKDDCVDYETLFLVHTDAQIIVNTTPVGMYPRCEESPISLDAFSRLEALVDVIYNPLRTNLVLDAQKLNIPAEGGLYMLVAQAVFASEFFLDMKYPKEILETIFFAIKRKKENVVLIGMPGCGKTTIGEGIAKDQPLLDSDALILNEITGSIRDYIQENGEAAFRDIEQRVIERISLQTGTVISVGGGAVLRRENVRNLKRNGRLVFLDMPLDRIAVTDDRPLSDSYDKLKNLYDVRHPIYTAAADITVISKETIIDTQNAVLEALE